MSYEPARWPKIVLLIPAAAIIIVFVGAGLAAQIDRYTNRAASAQARDAMRSCAAEHEIQLAWRQHPTMLTFDADVRYFSAKTEDEVATANCIVERTPEMSLQSEGQTICLDDEAVVEIERTVTGQHYASSEENYSFILSPCGSEDVAAET